MSALTVSKEDEKRVKGMGFLWKFRESHMKRLMNLESLLPKKIW